LCLEKGESSAIFAILANPTTCKEKCSKGMASQGRPTCVRARRPQRGRMQRAQSERKKTTKEN
jgi:hypothetical protein